MIAKAINLDYQKYRDLITKCEQEVLQTVPASHNRVVAEKKYILAKMEILAMDGDEEEITEGVWVYYTADYNMGTKKYPHVIKTVSCHRVDKVCKKTVLTTAGTRPNAARILAISKTKPEVY